MLVVRLAGKRTPEAKKIKTKQKPKRGEEPFLKGHDAFYTHEMAPT
jgi:hypothetical protein